MEQATKITRLDVLVALDDLRRRLRAPLYDPLTGEGCYGRRVAVETPVADMPVAYVPASMTADDAYATARTSAVEWQKLRCRHDFEYWAARCVKIKDKSTCRRVPFVLNAPQRRVLATLEDDRLAGMPLRIIILKARQWGGSTLVQMYMAWIQTCLRRNRNSVICAQVKDTSATILGMYGGMLADYPAELWEGDAEPAFRRYERTENVRLIAGRDCRVTLGSSERPDSVRGADYALAHLSETAFWKRTPRHTPQDVIQAICGSIALEPYTLVAIESTAKGVGDYFHTEWQRSKDGKGDKRAVFVPWYEIDIYSLACPCRQQLLQSLTPYERRLWRQGCDTDRLWWYRLKMKEFDSIEQFNNEFPGDDIEAFLSTDDSVFSLPAIEELRKGCRTGVRGDVDASGTRFFADAQGLMTMWADRVPGESYLVTVDVGGRSAKADWSVIAVMRYDSRPEVVAQWRGHIDHDLLAYQAVAVARYYNKALLAIESNTYETGGGHGTDDANFFVLEQLRDKYDKLYKRVNEETGAERVGFHTNVSTKSAIISTLVRAIREGAYIERSSLACDEYITYRRLDNGGFAARDGKHDDVLMTRGIALYIMSKQKSAPPMRYTQLYTHT